MESAASTESESRELGSSQPTSLARCRFCDAALRTTLVDLGMSPLCESYLDVTQLGEMEPFYPLHVYVCDQCFLVQLEQFVSSEHIFREYAYFSSYSDSWLQHAREYSDMIVGRLGLDGGSFVVEIGSNDGYLLKNFVGRGIPALGIEPASNVAKVAVERGVPTRDEFFSTRFAEVVRQEHGAADLIIGNNVLAQVPDINDCVGGIAALLGGKGVGTFEFPHLSKLIAENQLDTIYHEHFSYFSLIAVERIFAAHGLRIFDVDELPTHGGSLRIYVRHEEDISRPVSANVARVREAELAAGYDQIASYSRFEEKAKKTKWSFVEFLIRAAREGHRVAGYGAPGKGNTLLNYCGVRTDLIEYTVDRNPYKQGKFLPGTHIPIFHPDRIRETRPDFVVILPWNLKEEIMDQISYIREWGGRFVVAIPELRVDS